MPWKSTIVPRERDLHALQMDEDGREKEPPTNGITIETGRLSGLRNGLAGEKSISGEGSLPPPGDSLAVLPAISSLIGDLKTSVSPHSHRLNLWWKRENF